MNIYLFLFYFLILTITNYEWVNCGMVNVCSDIKDCVKCTESYINIFAFREHCRHFFF